MHTTKRIRRTIERELSRSLKRGLDIEERLATTAQLISEAEERFRKLAQPRSQE